MYFKLHEILNRDDRYFLKDDGETIWQNLETLRNPLNMLKNFRVGAKE